MGYAGSKTPVGARDLWRTPQYVFDYFDKQYGFTNDVAASDLNHLCPLYFTEEQNALEQDWGLVNWCNPPYSDIGPWVDKAIAESEKGKVTVMLVPDDTAIKWFGTAFNAARRVILITGRISFVSCETCKPIHGNNKGSTVFVFSPHGGRLVEMIYRTDMKESK